MIRTFADRYTEEVYVSGKSKHFPADVLRGAVRRVEYIDLAARLTDLTIPPSNRLYELEGDRAGLHAISVNDQWRVCFRYVEGDAYDVELTDCH